MHHNLKALANEDALLRTHCCRHKCFPVCPCVRDTKNVSPFPRVSGTQKMFLILFRNILCLQQMFPSLRSRRNIMGNNVSATMCPHLPGPLLSPRIDETLLTIFWFAHRLDVGIHYEINSF